MTSKDEPVAQALSLKGPGDDMKLQRKRAQEQGEMSHPGHIESLALFSDLVTQNALPD